ncbi:MAG: Uma2 family endonuclease [Chloroflexi bacterium]|nr:Uma2 family endonuclease [Chloroflexota bacterium]
MTSKLTMQTDRPDRLEQFPDFPPRDDMQNILYLYQPSYLVALARHLGHRDTTLVFGEIPVYWYPSRYARIPDLLVAFNIDPAAAISRNGYSIEEHSKPPDFVLEVASPTTTRNDYTQKREDYAAFGILEYWRFDPTGGRWYDAPLAGDRLVDGAYQPIGVQQSAEGHMSGRSDALGLDVCWENGRLRWRIPESGRYLETHEEEAEARIAAEGRAASAEARVQELEAELRRREAP